MQVFDKQRIPIKLWADRIDENAMVQAEDLASLPFAYHHIALMPDVHCGLGMPIGGVLVTKGVVVTNAVSVDIGCGICAVKSSLRVEEVNRKSLSKVVELIKERVPVGMEHHAHLCDESLLPQGYDVEKLPYVKTQFTAARHQLGTLGGGNHFMEIQK